MREKIILAPGANGSELMAGLAMRGADCINLRIKGSGALARLALMRSGIAVTEDFVDSREETALVAEAVKGEAYFEGASYSDIRKLTSALKRMRTLVADGDEAAQLEDILGKGIFEAKNSALLSVYKKYMKIIADRKLTDSVSIIRRAVSDSITIDADFCVLEEYPLSPLDRALIMKISGGRVEESSLKELYHAGDTPLKIDSFKNCYGAANEVETILADIYSGKSLDKCTVAVTDPATYGQLFFDYALLYDIPITLGCGIPIINSNPARLLVLYYQWMTGGFFGAAAINAMLTSPAFDRSKLYDLYPEKPDGFSRDTYAKVLGGLRLTNDRTVNEKRIADFKKSISEEEALIDPDDARAYKTFIRRKLCIPYLEVIAEELSMPAEDFIVKYSYIRKGFDTNSQRLLMALDMAASSAIYEELKVIRASGVKQTTEDMIMNVLKLAVAGSRSEEGRLYVTGIDGALSSVRENLYIAGLSASNYPGSPRENYLLLDSDIRLFGEDAGYLTSEGRISRKQQNLLTLAGLASGLGSAVNVSYAGLNVSELKKDNASSLVFELYRRMSETNVTLKELEDHIERVAYFEPAISVTRKVGEAYNGEKNVVPRVQETQKGAVSVEPDSNAVYSPSDLSVFFNCPRAFMLGRVLGIRQPDEYKPFEVISPMETGTLAHALMAELGNSAVSLEDFLKLSGECFDRFISEHPPLVLKNADAERAEFLDMMENAYNMDPHREVILEEEDIGCVHESGVRLHGFPDRVEKLDDGSCIIVDFKSGRSIGHVQDDIDTCLQVVIYAYLMEQNGFTVSGGEFRYLRLGETVSCKYDDEMKQNLAGKMEVFKQHLEASDFPIPDNAYMENRAKDDPDPCRYCSFGLICQKGTEYGGIAE